LDCYLQEDAPEEKEEGSDDAEAKDDGEEEEPEEEEEDEEMVDPKEKYEEGEFTPHTWRIGDWVEELELKWQVVGILCFFGWTWQLGAIIWHMNKL
jgi:hypothetical protein